MDAWLARQVRRVAYALAGTSSARSALTSCEDGVVKTADQWYLSASVYRDRVDNAVSSVEVLGGGTSTPAPATAKMTSFMRYQRQYGATAVDISSILNSQNYLYDSNNQPSWLAAGLQNTLSNYLGVWANPHPITKISVAMCMTQVQNMTGSTISNGSTVQIDLRVYRMFYNSYVLVGTVPVTFTMAGLSAPVTNNNSSNRSTGIQYAFGTADVTAIPAGSMLGASIYCANGNFRPLSDFIVGVTFSE